MSSEIKSEKNGPVEIITISSFEESVEARSTFREVFEVSSTSFEDSEIEVLSTKFKTPKDYLSVSSGTSSDEGPLLTQAPEEEPTGHTLTLDVSTSSSSSSSLSKASSSSIGKLLMVYPGRLLNSSFLIVLGMILTLFCILGAGNYNFSEISAGPFPSVPVTNVRIFGSDDATVVSGNLSSATAAGNNGRIPGIGRGFTYAPAAKNPYKRKRTVERPAGSTYTRENSQCELFKIFIACIIFVDCWIFNYLFFVIF